ncbi:putative periplasmic lipoprotein [Clostridium baratii]|uniref:hypothetical protein n=1 Tax=Clostridium baratii TaxID=1561 RepID=UPI00374E6A27
MKKKFLGLLIVSMISVGLLVGCGSSNTNQTSSNSNQKQSEQQTDQQDQDDTKKETPKVTIKDLQLVDFKVRKPDSIGNIYMETKFKNNSNQIIKGIEYTYEVNGEKTYLSTYDTLRPGDTSTLEECFGPKSGKKDDAKLLKAEFTVVNKDGSNTYIEYDAKLGTYTQS